MLLGRRHIGPIGIDVGEASIRLMQVIHRPSGPQVLAMGQQSLDEPVAASWTQPGLAATLREMVAAGGFKGRRVAVALGPADAQVKNMRLPPMPAEELTAAVQFEAADRFSFGDKPATYRYIPMGMVGHGNEAQQELVAIGVADATVRSCIQTLSDAGLIVQAIDFSACALFRAFERFLRRHDDAAEVNAFVDLGYSGARVVISQGQTIVFVKMLDVGGSAFDQAVAQGLSVSKSEARHLRRRVSESDNLLNDAGGRSIDAATRQRLTELLDGPYQQLSKEISLCLRYCMVTYRGHQCDSVTCVGGESYSAELLDRISVVSGVTARQGHPLRSLALERHVEPLPGGSGYGEWATALGLALRTEEGSQEEVA